jgi:hypothetical protein
LGGRGKDEGVRGRTRLTGPSESQSETWLPSPAPRREVRGGAGVGQGTGSAQNPPLTSHRPARPSLGPSGRSAVRVPPPQQLPSGSHGECTHVPTATGPTAAHAVRGGTARGWSMRTSRGRLRALGAEGRRGGGGTLQEESRMAVSRLEKGFLTNRWEALLLFTGSASLAPPSPVTASLWNIGTHAPTQRLSSDFSVGHVSMHESPKSVCNTSG